MRRSEYIAAGGAPMKVLFSTVLAWSARVARAVGGYLRNRQAVAGTLFTAALVVAVGANPPGWTAAGFLVIVLYLAAAYVLSKQLFGNDVAWSEVHLVAKLLKSRDLRRSSLPDEKGLSSGNRDGIGHMGQLYRELEETHGNLGELVTQVRRSAEATAAAADDVANGNSNLSKRTEEQGSTLEETASAMEQLSVTVRENAESCRNASELAANAAGVARKGTEVARSAVSTMEIIDQSSKRIVDIIGVIESISFQTNILALNAAVEAAHAGEQGRGFAVVASEVRSLAKRSADAAKEIKALIGESVANVGQGTVLVNDTGRVIQEVSASMERVNEIIGRIAIASREQSTGVEGVNNSVMLMQDATQRNLEVVHQAADASGTLKSEASRLSRLVARFKIDADRATRQSASQGLAPAPRSAAVATLPSRRRDREELHHS